MFMSALQESELTSRAKAVLRWSPKERVFPLATEFLAWQQSLVVPDPLKVHIERIRAMLLAGQPKP